MIGTIVLSENACFVDHFCFIENEGIVFLFRIATVIGVAIKDPVDLSHAESWDSIVFIPIPLVWSIFSSEFIWPPLDRISDPLSCFHNGVVYKSTLSTKGCTAIIFFTQPCFVLRQQSNPVSIRRFENSNLDGDSRI